MNQLEIRNVCKRFDGKDVLSNVSLSIKKGEIFGILGLSGAGKSTLIRCINGLEKVDDGEIYFNGELLCDKNHPVTKENKRKIAMIFQSFNLLEQKNILANVELALNLQKRDPNNTKAAVEALTRVGLADKLKAYPSELSGGQKQRVAIARALVMKPEILLSDEATSALDPKTSQSILNLLKDLNKELGLTIVMISHQLNVIEHICNKVAIIDHSKIIETGDMADIFLNPKEDFTKELIYANHIKTLVDDKKIIRILFNGDLDRPVIADIVQDCMIEVSIVYADSKVIDGKVFGQVVLKMPKNESDIIKLKKYLEVNNIKYEEVNTDGFMESDL